MTPREMKREAGVLAAMRALNAADRAILDGNPEMAEARLTLAEAAVLDVAERLQHDYRLVVTGKDGI